MNRREQNAQPDTKKNKFSLKNVLKEVGGGGQGGGSPGEQGAGGVRETGERGTGSGRL